MIYTVTLNPALDIFYTSNKLDFENYTYAYETQEFPGGKSINVSRILSNLRIHSIGTGFLGGNTGRFIQDWFDENNVESHFIKIDDETRTNIKLKTPEKQLTVAGKYPTIHKDDLNGLLYYLSKVREGDIVVAGGSIPLGVEDDIYIRIAELCKSNKAFFVIDTDPKKLLEILHLNPLLVKPNINDLAKMFDLDEIKSESELLKYGHKLTELGATNAIVSVGEDGSYLFTKEGDVYRAHALKSDDDVNTFNTRDAMIAGFIGVYMTSHDPVESYRMASAAATATAQVRDLPSEELILDIYNKFEVEKIEL